MEYVQAAGRQADGPLGMIIAPDMQTKEIKVIEVKPESLAEIYGIQVGK